MVSQPEHLSTVFVLFVGVLSDVVFLVQFPTAAGITSTILEAYRQWSPPRSAIPGPLQAPG
jgi:hypothetical protein